MTEIQTLENEFRVRFDGQLHQVSANTLINSLLNISTIIQEVNEELNLEFHTDNRIDVKIKALEQGSFDINLLLDFSRQQIQNMFNNKSIPFAANIIQIFTDLLELKKHLGGKKAKTITEKGSEISIENNKGKIIIVGSVVYNIYSHNQPVQDAISNNFETLQNDASITSFEITDAKKRIIFQATHDEFDEMSKKSEIETENTKVFTEVANLHIFKIVFEDKYKWEFFYRGNKISANIEDEDFFKMIDSGEKFAKGDMLVVDLQVTQIFDPAVNTFINHSYQIKKVVRHTPRGEQQKIDLE